MESKRKEAAFLVRCSTDKQDYERQLEDLSIVADRFGFHVSESNIFGEYITGKDDTTKRDRISIIKLRAAAEKHQFDVILVAEVSRMSRDSVSGRVYVRQFCNLEIPIYFRDKMKWTIDPQTMREDESFIKELGLYFDGAAEYLKSMKTQIASGRRASLRNNQMIMGHVPFGYKKRGGKDKRHRNEVVVDPETAPIVQDIFSMYLEPEASLKSVTLAIDAKYGLRKTTGTIYQIIAREEYCTGKHTMYMKDPDNKDNPAEPFLITFEPIITQEVFEAAKKKREEHCTHDDHYPERQTHVLTKLIKCPFCGFSFSPKKRSGEKPGVQYRIINGKVAYSWICMTRICHAAADCKSRINLNDEKVETIVWDFLKAELMDFADPGKDTREERIQYFKQKISEAQGQIPLFEQEIKKVDTLQRRAYQAYINAPEGVEEIALENYNATLVKVKKIKDDYSSEIESLKKKIKSFEGSIKYYSQSNLTQQYIDSIENDTLEKRKIVLQLVERIRPFSIRVGVVILELTTINGLYYILYDGYQVGEKRVAHYIAAPFAVWHTEKEGQLKAYETESYFTLKNTDIINCPDDINIEHVSFKDMVRVCEANNWRLPYNYIYTRYSENKA